MLSLSKSLCALALFGFLTSCDAFQPKGSAAVPLDKKKIAVLGSGGYLGGIATGFLQRASSLYRTGLAQQFRCIGASAQTAALLNSVLSKNFVLAQCDETFIKMTDLSSPEAIAQRLDGYNAILLGCDMVTEIRPVVGGTYDKTPNDKAWEVYWDARKGRQTEPDPETLPIIDSILDNTLVACEIANLQHIYMVGKKSDTDKNLAMQQRLINMGIPYTFIQYSGELETCPDYSYRKGVQGNLEIVTTNEDYIGEESSFLFREDLAALCIQCMQSLSWTESRCLYVRCDGTQAIPSTPSGLRADQEWCVNSHILEEKLAGIP